MKNQKLFRNYKLSAELSASPAIYTKQVLIAKTFRNLPSWKLVSYLK